MAYKKSSSCGGLRYSTTDFTEVDGVLTAAGNSELVGDPFLASMCGGIWFDDGVFGEVGKVITTAGTTAVENSFVANCSLLFDKDKFEIGEDKEIVLVAPPVPTLNYLCFTAQETGSTVGTAITGSFTLPVLEYSTDGTNWSNFALGSDGTVVTLANVGDKVYLRGNNSSFSKGAYQYIKFVMSGKIAASGNVMSLLDKTCESVTIDSEYCYAFMFNNCTSLTTPPELPATTLAEGCYGGMFSGCTSLTTPPELPATTLANYCYNSMFQGCTSLITAPTLPATTLANGCYESMFNSCTSLITAPTLPATTLASQCYYSMFDSCTSLITAPTLPATTLASQCYESMFDSCTSLITAPALPATTLAESCYAYMFEGCTSLYVSDTSGDGYDKAWNIPSEGVSSGDYTFSSMFTNCLGTRSTDSPNFNGVQKTYYTQNVPV